jgi:hypothetical protein
MTGRRREGGFTSFRSGPASALVSAARPPSRLITGYTRQNREQVKMRKTPVWR